MNEEGHKIKLLLAGYDVTSNVSRLKVDLKNTILIDNPDEERLFKLMKSVDVAIQLRKNPHGESSGCVAQLLGMKQNLITQTGFIPTDFNKYCILISLSATYKEIYDAILKAKNGKKNEIPETLIKQYSFDELSDKLYKLSNKK